MTPDAYYALADRADRGSALCDSLHKDASTTLDECARAIRDLTDELEQAVAEGYNVRPQP